MGKCAFIIRNGNTDVETFTFPLNPENLSYNVASRVYQNQTRSALSVQRYGRGFTSITLSGTTGFRGGSGRAKDNGNGKAVANNLRAFLNKYMDRFSDDVANDYKLIFCDYLNNIISQVEIQTNGYSITQSVNSPLMYNYNIPLIIVGNPAQASSDEINNAILGNDQSVNSGAEEIYNSNVNVNSRSYVDTRTMPTAQEHGIKELDNTL